MNTISVDCRMAFHSGIGTYIRNIVPRVVSALTECQFRLLIPAELKNTQLFSGNNVEIYRSKSGIYSLSEQLELLRFARGSRGLVWSPHYIIPVFGQMQQLTVIHDTFHLSMTHYLRGYHQKLYARLMFEVVKRRSTHIICVSEFTASELKRHLGIPDRRVTIIHNGVDESWSSISKSAEIHPKPYIVFVGNVKPHKNVCRLMNAFTRISHKIPHDLLIVGQTKGFILPDYDAQKVATMHADRIRIIGQVSDTSLQQLVSQADLLVLPSLYEGFGLPALEAMACGCPVAVSNRASLPEVCGNAALYFDPEDEESISSVLACLVDDAGQRNRLIRLGYARARNFSWERAAKRTVEVLRQVLQGAQMDQPIERSDGDTVHDAS